MSLRRRGDISTSRWPVSPKGNWVQTQGVAMSGVGKPSSLWQRRLALAALVVLTGVPGFASGSQSGAGETTGKDAAVSIQIFQFKPTTIEVKAGTRVTWTNGDDIEHTVTSGAPEKKDGRFDSKLNGKEATASITFTKPGTYPYFCDRHQSMRGEIRVK